MKFYHTCSEFSVSEGGTSVFRKLKNGYKGTGCGVTKNLIFLTKVNECQDIILCRFLNLVKNGLVPANFFKIKHNNS